MLKSWNLFSDSDSESLEAIALCYVDQNSRMSMNFALTDESTMVNQPIGAMLHKWFYHASLRKAVNWQTCVIIANLLYDIGAKTLSYRGEEGEIA